MEGAHTEADPGDPLPRRLLLDDGEDCLAQPDLVHYILLIRRYRAMSAAEKKRTPPTVRIRRRARTNTAVTGPAPSRRSDTARDGILHLARTHLHGRVQRIGEE